MMYVATEGNVNYKIWGLLPFVYVFTYFFRSTVEPGYNNHGNNEFTDIMDKYNSIFLVPYDNFTAKTLFESPVYLNQRCPTHSPLATCGEWTFKCGEWVTFQISKNWDVLIKILDHIPNLINTFLLQIIKSLEKELAKDVNF
jgi:hypothetical protein